MTVSELIDRLKEFDGNAGVFFHDDDMEDATLSVNHVNLDSDSDVVLSYE